MNSLCVTKSLVILVIYLSVSEISSYEVIHYIYPTILPHIKPRLHTRSHSNTKLLKPPKRTTNMRYKREVWLRKYEGSKEIVHDSDYYKDYSGNRREVNKALDINKTEAILSENMPKITNEVHSLEVKTETTPTTGTNTHSSVVNKTDESSNETSIEKTTQATTKLSTNTITTKAAPKSPETMAVSKKTLRVDTTTSFKYIDSSNETEVNITPNKIIAKARQPSESNDAQERSDEAQSNEETNNENQNKRALASDRFGESHDAFRPVGHSHDIGEVHSHSRDSETENN